MRDIRVRMVIFKYYDEWNNAFKTKMNENIIEFFIVSVADIRELSSLLGSNPCANRKSSVTPFTWIEYAKMVYNNMIH